MDKKFVSRFCHHFLQPTCGELKIIPKNYSMYCELFTLLEEIGGSKYRDFASVSEFFDSKIAEKKFGHLQKKYPNINATVTYDELKSALQEANILKLEQGRYALDIDGYQNYIECERVRDEVIQEEKTVYRAIENDFSVPDVELQKARVKVKEMINRNV